MALTHDLLPQQQNSTVDLSVCPKSWAVQQFRSLHVSTGATTSMRRPTLQNPLSNLSCINNVLQKEGILLNTRSSKCLTVTSHSNNKLVISQVKYLTFLSRPLRLVCLGKTRSMKCLARELQRSSNSCIFNPNSLLVEVHIICPALEELHTCRASSDGLKGCPELESSDSRRCKQGSEDKVSSWRDHNRLKFLLVQLP